VGGALTGVKVALLEARMSEELGSLIRRQGGEPYNVPAVREEARDAGPEVKALLDALAAEEEPVVLLSTGVGVAGLFREAHALGRAEELRASLKRAITVARGPKPTAALKKEGLEPKRSAKTPFTTADLLAALDGLDLAGRYVAVLHYGERNEGLLDALKDRRVRLHEALLYEWRLPAELGPLRGLVGELIAGQVGAIAFTSQVQARHLFQLARESGQADALAEALRTRTVVAAVGPTCAAALQELGVEPHVVPEHPKMGPMVVELAKHFGAAGERRGTGS
jgi:uroporphyrinogen-III synthase